MTLSVIIPFHAGDRAQALRLIEWIQQLGPQPARFFLLTQADQQDPAILPDGWEWLTDYAQVKGNWSQDHKDASAANSMWRQAAREMHRRKAGPWLWLEPDAIPLTPDWATKLIAEYAACQCHFMGGKAPKGDRMSGVAVYAQDTVLLAETAFVCDPVAFDYAAAPEFNRSRHLTTLIADQFCCDPFKDQADFEARVPKEAVIHHGDKSGSIYTFASNQNETPKIPFSLDIGATRRSDVPKTFHPDTAPGIGSHDVLAQSVPQWTKQNAEEMTMREHLDAIMQQVGTDAGKRQLLYAELKKRGIECGRKKRALQKS